MSDADTKEMLDTVKADAIVTTLREGLALCLERAAAGPRTKSADVHAEAPLAPAAS